MRRQEEQVDWVDEMYAVVRDLQGRVIALEKRLKRIVEDNDLEQDDEDYGR